ncbi:MAG: hypothetical protein GXO48_03035 [Chlorobi bacterium]|nr:hypothetical protein [Chlorobiota bacterium]
MEVSEARLMGYLHISVRRLLFVFVLTLFLGLTSNENKGNFEKPYMEMWISISADSLFIEYSATFEGFWDTLKKNKMKFEIIRESYMLEIENQHRSLGIFFPVSYSWFKYPFMLNDTTLYLFSLKDYYPEGFVYLGLSDKRFNPIYQTIIKPEEQVIFRGGAERDLHWHIPTNYEIKLPSINLVVDKGISSSFELLKFVSSFGNCMSFEYTICHISGTHSFIEGLKCSANVPIAYEGVKIENADSNRVFFFRNVLYEISEETETLIIVDSAEIHLELFLYLNN